MIRPQASSLLLPLRGCLQVSGQLLSPRESLPVLICPNMIQPKNVIPERVTVPELEFHSVKKSSNSTTPWKNSHSFRYEIDFSLERNQYRMRVQISKIQHGVFLVESGSHRSSFNKSEIGRETGDYASEMSRSFQI